MKSTAQFPSATPQHRPRIPNNTIVNDEIFAADIFKVDGSNFSLEQTTSTYNIVSWGSCKYILDMSIAFYSQQIPKIKSESKPKSVHSNISL